VFGHRQAQTGAAVFADGRTIGLAERLKKALYLYFVPIRLGKAKLRKNLE
jgi:hypothetical protein